MQKELALATAEGGGVQQSAGVLELERRVVQLPKDAWRLIEKIGDVREARAQTAAVAPGLGLRCFRVWRRGGRGVVTEIGRGGVRRKKAEPNYFSAHI